MGEGIAGAVPGKEGGKNMNWRIGLFCVVSGLCFTVSAAGAGHFVWWWLAGVLIAASVLPIVIYGPGKMTAQFNAISLVIIVVGLMCTMSEGMLFYPDTRAQMSKALWGGTVLYLIASAAMVALARVLKLNRESEIAVEPRSITTAAPMVILSALSYVLYYLIFGAITFEFFTKKYYPHATEQVAALGGWFWVYQFARGLLMVLATVPVIYTLRLPRWKAALVVGLLVWIVGGAAPLLVPNAEMVALQRYEHIVEIFTQNFCLGVTATLLLRRKSASVATPARHATFV
jgi:hypothetical protein